jgi:hypothetical protein
LRESERELRERFRFDFPREHSNIRIQIDTQKYLRVALVVHRFEKTRKLLFSVRCLSVHNRI